METLEQVYFISQIIAGAAVIVSLIYVGLQLKQNTRAMKQDSVKNIIESLRDATANLSQSEDKAEIAFAAFANPSSLTGAQKFRSYVMFQNLLSAFELVHFQQTEGALEEHHWSGQQQYLIDICKFSGMQEYWAARNTWFRPDFREYMDEVILPGPASPDFKLVGT